MQMVAGHVMRCLALAQSLKENGANAEFICRIQEGNLIKKIRLSGFNIHELKVLNKAEGDNMQKKFGLITGLADHTIE